MISIDPRPLRYFDWLSFVLILLFCSIGLLTIFSATTTTDHSYSVFFKKQFLGVLSGIGIYFLACCIDHRSLERWGHTLYFVTIGILLFTLFKGSIGLGAQRWINVGFFKFQPSEVLKLFFPAFFSYHLAPYLDYDFKPRVFLPIVTIVSISCFLIMKQPDLGTALIILFACVLLLWFAGLPTYYLFAAALCTAIATPLLWRGLKPYQKQRIIVFFGGGNSKKERYQIEQSQIAIGSGGLTGKGYLQGTQTHLNFLPESRTDCIFSVLCEEFGFIGAFLLIVLFFIFFARIFSIICTIKNTRMQLLAFGLVIPSILSTVINMAMVMGLLPIVGIPLPFVTYGVTHLWITFASFGWLNGIIARRFLYG